MGNAFGIGDGDLAALQSLRDAWMACNAAENVQLQLQSGGTFGMVYDAFLHAATQILGSEAMARRLRELLIDNGESVAYCLGYMRQNDYPWIVAYCKFWGSLPYWVDEQVMQAYRDGAPDDAIHPRHNSSGEWCTIDDIHDKDMRRVMGLDA